MDDDKKINEQFRNAYLAVVENILNDKKRAELEIKHGRDRSSVEIDALISKTEKLLQIANNRYKNNRRILAGLELILINLKLFGTIKFKISSVDEGHRYILSELKKLIGN